MSFYSASACSHGAHSSRDDLQIDQSVEPTRVTIAGSAQSLQLALCMVRDIVAGNFKVQADSHGRARWRACSSGSIAVCRNSL